MARSPLYLATLLTFFTPLACTDDGGSTTGATEETAGDGDPGDGDPGDGDPGDGDGDPGDGDPGDGDGDPGECPTPLSEDIEPWELGFGIFSEFEMTPGSGRTFEVGVSMCCVFWEPIPVCAEYSVSPADAGATIDPLTGEFSLADDVADSTLFEITADIESGLATVTGHVFAYVPELHPLKGSYSEVARIPCDNGPEFVPSDPIGELRFSASGVAEVTWQPFEIYVDYWADYVADVDTGALSMTPTGGNYLPDDVDGEGSFVFEGSELVLQDIWLGTSMNAVEPAACGHRFQ